MRGKWENGISGEQLDSVPEETLVVLATDPIVVRKHNRPLLDQERGHRLTEENPRMVLASEAAEERVLLK